MQTYIDVAELTVEEPQIEILAGASEPHAIFRVSTRRAPQFIDITEVVGDLVETSRLSSGVVVVTSQHTTASIKVNENEPELLRDMEKFLCDIAPRDRYYRHNDFTIRTTNMEEDECPNAHSHCQHLLLSASESIPVSGGRMMLGKWQRLFLVELDRPRPRQVVVTFIGNRT
ncbi:MAG TPA: secondary thiamine-phosphate synthase enzyme YjbQ [Chloroflexota bacterium]|nr:secondary thiamine-phosphate synthase enzyme YjbQ [Chloroflexota bacterium]